ncbi:hypothetical protein HKX48_002793 [Thoreauomyces humboldtii]|nr:hypothetical protein HKX48_002793 [Thoreauomyces humboldtii]
MDAPAPVQPTAPIRFADFFFQCGLNPTAKLADRRVLEDGSAAGDIQNKQTKPESAATPASDLSSPMHLPEAKLKKQQHPLDWKFAPEVLCRYPNTDYSDKERFPAYLSMFTFPDNIKLRHEDNGPLPEKYHSFIITEETGAKCYGVCVTIYERLHPSHAAELEAIAQDLRSGALGTTDLEYIQHIQSELAAKQEALLHARMGMPEVPPLAPPPATTSVADSPSLNTEHTLQDVEEKVRLYRDLLAPLNTLLVDVENVYVPRSLGVLSHWPWHDFLKDWLCEVIKVARGEYEECSQNKVIAPMERFIVNLIHEIPLPPPGKLELSVRVGQLQLFASRPPVNTISVLKNFSLYPLFRALSVQNIVTLFELALSEQKIIFLSSHLAMLTFAAESLCLFFFPLFWQHILIPILPARLLSYLQAPMPYIIGVQRDYFTTEVQDEWRPPDAAVVDLDNDTISLSEQPPALPVRERQKLTTRLEKATGVYVQFPSAHRAQASLGVPERPTKRADRGVPLTVQYALPLNKHAPTCCESARKVTAERPPRGSILARARTNSEVPETSRARSGSTASSAGAWLDKIQKTFSPSGAPSGFRDSDGSLSSGSSTATTEDKNATWWNRNKDRTLSIDQESIVSSSGKPPGDDNASLSSPERQSAGSSDASITPRLRNPFSKRLPSKAEIEKDKSMKTSGSNASLASMFSTFSNNRGLARPPGITTKQSNRYSVSGASTASSSVMSSTPSSVHYAQFATSEESSAMQGLPVRKKEGHSFYTLSVQSPWGATLEGTTSRDGASTSQELYIGDSFDSTDASKQSSMDRPPPNPGSNSKGLNLGSLSRNATEIQRAPRSFSFKKSPSRGKRLDAFSGDGGSASQVSPLRNLQDGRRRRSSAVSPVVSLEVGATCRVCREDLMEGEATSIMQCDSSFDEKKIQMSFLKVFTSLLRHYRQHIATPEQLRALAGDEGPVGSSRDSFKALDMDSLGEEWFRKADFLAAAEKESRAFMVHLVETQAFAQFTLDRVERPESDYEVLFFDECIKEKRNRSKLRLGKESTPFLHETAYDVKSTITCLEVRKPDDSGSSRSEGVPLYLDESLLKSFRVVQPLVTQADHRIMRSMTNELTYPSYQKRKQDFSKWMRTKWKHFQKVGGGEVVALGFLSDDQRRELFDERIEEVTSVIDHYEQLHLSTQKPSEVRSALGQLHAQNLVLMRAADEEQLVDEGEQEDLQGVYMRLFRVITIYEDHMTSLKAAGTDVDASEDSLDAGGSSYKLNLSMGLELNFGSVSDWLHKVGNETGGSEEGLDGIRQPTPARSDSKSLDSAGRDLERHGLGASVDIAHHLDLEQSHLAPSAKRTGGGLEEVSPEPRTSVDAPGLYEAASSSDVYLSADIASTIPGLSPAGSGYLENSPRALSADETSMVSPTSSDSEIVVTNPAHIPKAAAVSTMSLPSGGAEHVSGHARSATDYHMAGKPDFSPSGATRKLSGLGPSRDTAAGS